MMLNKKISLYGVMVGLCLVMPVAMAKSPVPQVRMAQPRMAEKTTPEMMLNAINQLRSRPQQCGKKLMPAVAPLKWNTILALSAQKHAEDMANNQFYSHKNKHGLDPFERHKRDGYQGWGGVENIGAGYETLADTLAGLMESPTHCQTLMNQYITEVGMAHVFHAQSPYRNYWVQNFGIDPVRFQELKGYPVEKAKRLPFSRMFKE